MRIVACVLAGLLAAVPAARAVNSMTVTDKSGAAQTNYPLQFARPFVQGEIANYPQVLVNGTAVSTQADVKQRWPDGSVKHAILSLLVSSIPANGSVTLTFQNQASGNNTALTQAQMLATAYNFDAVIQIVSGGNTRTASARTMLTNNAFTYWTSGPIATTIILADHSTARAYDMGFDALNSIRPIFEATFWPTVNKVRVRFIGEDCNSEYLEDVACDLTLKTGSSPQTTVYTKAGYVHKAATRWTQVFWINTAPEYRINVNPNLAYLEQTSFVPTYDTSLVIPEATIAAAYASWQTTAKDIQDGGWWCKYMPTTGGRDDIGHMPKWSTQWLYTGDYRSKEMAFGNADLAGNWLLQVREGNSAKLYDRAQTVSALGKPVSICARPPLWIFDGRGGTDPSYWIPIQGTIIPTPGGDWTNDNAHQPDPFSVQYMLTGDHWYLEELQMWTAFDALTIWPAMRGPNGYAGIVDQVRGDAWMLRTRASAAFLTPDGTAEQGYFNMLVSDAIAHWEGWHGVAGTGTQSSLWKWAKDQVGVSYGLTPVSPLNFFDWQSDLRGYYDVTIDGGVAAWMNYLTVMELGIASQQGFATGALAKWHGQFLAQQFYDTGYYIYHLADYVSPAHRADGTWVGSWAEAEQIQVAQGHSDAQSLADFNGSATDVSFGYSTLATAAAAEIATFPGGDTAWSFLLTNARTPNLTNFANDPKCALVPRGAVRTVGTGKTYATVQAAVDAASDYDVIQVFPGTYTQASGWASIAKNNLTLIGMGSPRPVLDANGSCLGSKGIFNISGRNTTVQNLEFKNCRVASGNNSACIRLQGRNLTVSGCYFHDSDYGIVSDSFTGSNVTITTSEFYNNGYAGTASGNIKVGVVDSFTLQFCHVHMAVGGDEVKSSALVNSVFYNRITDETATDSYVLEFPAGGTAYVLGNMLQKSAGGNGTIVQYGTGNPKTDLHVVSNTLVSNRTTTTGVNNASATNAQIQNNIFQGVSTIASGVNTQTTNWNTSNAYLQDAANYDYHLTAGSTGAINAGSAPAAVNDVALVPVYQYLHPCSYEVRPTNGSALDIGAFESIATFQNGLNSYTGCTDSYLSAGAATTNYGTTTKLTVCGYADGGATNRMRPIVRFDLSGIPTATTISSATLYVYSYDTAQVRGSNGFYGVYPLTRSWTESQVTWNIAATGTNWTTAGGDFTSTTADGTAPKQAAAGVWYAFTVTSRVQSMISNPAGNYGWVLKCTDENQHNQDYFTSSNNTDTVHRPRLVVNY